MMNHDTEFDLERFLSYVESLSLNPPRGASVDPGGSSGAASTAAHDDPEHVI